MAGGLGTILPLIIFIAIFYFLLIRPQQKRSKETRAMQSSLARGDKIVTIGGLHGTIDTLDDQKVVLRCGNAKLSFDRNAIRGVEKKTAEKHEEVKEAKNETPAENKQEKVEE